MPQTPFTPGMRIQARDAEWLVTKVAPANSQRTEYALFCSGADDLVRGHQAVFLTQLDSVKPVDPRKSDIVPDISSGFQLAKLFLEAQLRQMPLTDVQAHVQQMGAFQPMRFQVEAVEKALMQMRPRLLLADAVGLGKTIEVGMILTELMRRGRADRILVLTKKSMLNQFQAELWNRFALPLVRLDSKGIAKIRLRIPASKNPFEVYHRAIISMDTLKDVGRYRPFLEKTMWDVVVIDEAHNVAGASVPEKNLSYRLAKLLSRKTQSLILTTATPHNGKRETFGRLISLLDPTAIPDPKLKDYSAQDISPFFLMRFKEDIRDQVGENLAQREVIPLAQTSIAAKDKEERVYTSLAQLRHHGQSKEHKNKALLQWGLYKRFLSSPEACRSTIKKRLQSKDVSETEANSLRALQDQLQDLDITHTARYELLKNILLLAKN